jgi:hypothetical protein
MIGLNTTVPQVAADDYTVTVTKVQISDWCHQYALPLPSSSTTTTTTKRFCTIYCV